MKLCSILSPSTSPPTNQPVSLSINLRSFPSSLPLSPPLCLLVPFPDSIHPSSRSQICQTNLSCRAIIPDIAQLGCHRWTRIVLTAIFSTPITQVKLMHYSPANFFTARIHSDFGPRYPSCSVFRLINSRANASCIRRPGYVHTYHQNRAYFFFTKAWGPGMCICKSAACMGRAGSNLCQLATSPGWSGFCSTTCILRLVIPALSPRSSLTEPAGLNDNH